MWVPISLWVSLSPRSLGWLVPKGQFSVIRNVWFFFLLLRSWFSTLWQFLCRFTPRQYPVISQIKRVPGRVESGWRRD